MRKVLRAARTMALLAIISDTTQSMPKERTNRRNGRSVTPAIGANTTGVPNSSEPIRILVSFGGLPNLWAFLGRIQPHRRQEKQ